MPQGCVNLLATHPPSRRRESLGPYGAAPAPNHDNEAPSDPHRFCHRGRVDDGIAAKFALGSASGARRSAQPASAGRRLLHQPVRGSHRLGTLGGLKICRSSAEPLRSAPAPALAPLPNRAVWPVQSIHPQVVTTRRQLQGELRAMLYGVRCTSSVCLGTPPSAGGEDTAAAAGGAAGSRPRSCDPLQRRAHHVPRLNAPGNTRHTVTLYSGAPLRRCAQQRILAATSGRGSRGQPRRVRAASAGRLGGCGGLVAASLEETPVV